MEFDDIFFCQCFGVLNFATGTPIVLYWLNDCLAAADK